MRLGNFPQDLQFIQEGRRSREDKFSFLGDRFRPLQDASRALVRHFPGGETFRTDIAAPSTTDTCRIGYNRAAVHDRSGAPTMARKAAHRIRFDLKAPLTGLGCTPLAIAL